MALPATNRSFKLCLAKNFLSHSAVSSFM